VPDLKMRGFCGRDFKELEVKYNWIVPDIARENDLIVIIDRVSIPIILRPRGDSEESRRPV